MSDVVVGGDVHLDRRDVILRAQEAFRAGDHAEARRLVDRAQELKDEIELGAQVRALCAEADRLEADREEFRAAGGDLGDPGTAKVRAIASDPGSVTLDLSAAANYMEMRQRGAVGSDLAEMQQRTMLGTGLATPTSGYTLVPETWEYMIYASLVSHSGVRQAGPRVVTTQNGDPMHFPTGPNLRQVPADRTHYAPAEGTAIAAGGEHDLTFDEVVLGAFRYMSILPVARTFLVDQQTNLESFLPDYLAKDIAHLSENDLLHGDGGANEPEGVLQHGVAANTVTVVDKDAVTYANLVEAKYRLDPALHNQANRANWSAGTPMGGMIVWMMHPETFANVLFIEGGDKRLALIPSARDGEPDRILGHPVVLSPGMPKIGVVSSKIILVGNFTQAYVVRQVGSLELATSEHVEFRANQIVFRTTLRCDAAYIDQSAIAVIATPSS